MKKLQILVIVLALALLPDIGHAASQQKVVYSWPKTLAADSRGHYPIALLHLALEKSGQAYQAHPSETELSQFRTLRQLEVGAGIDVVWTMSSPEREKQLRPIRIPIDRGLIGWRLLLIRQQDQQLYLELQDKEQLKHLRTIQGLDWPDYQVLQSNGFAVSSSASYKGMFHMLNAKRIDYFPRSVTELPAEIAAFPAYQLMAAPKWVLHYPAVLYFFVNKNNDKLAEAIEQGLRIAMADGSMKQLFMQHFYGALQQADLKSRSVLRLNNPLLTPETPLTDHSLWFDPQQGY
ncbi:MAG: transporter substrate-binding domain-containing protein [Gammaproteobacteria bacterium]|nr:transporter substrate-binding domain-containing protein [Gammaproteobacteria bacterium]MBU2059473.1 transporter substrate-binding domain-containing protein [Gammaproteobacteria bacterium]MBU2175896.1 transporter substrate-binding domain-containing protein [Gammaproteobacteria bacterium]MBU2246310.1 transporter substrate-binding domain-containing protein [Gammaproteobacteria bacterium]MBU2345401.1 transporter substrate-binding domain-containing protein [Gammaproteobacteria bacterium]